MIKPMAYSDALRIKDDPYIIVWVWLNIDAKMYQIIQ